MPRPNFWRLKRKTDESAKPSVENPPKISQRTISSFFSAPNLKVKLSASDVPEDIVIEEPSFECHKRAKLDRDTDVDNTSDVTKVKLSESVLYKLKGFSASSVGDLTQIGLSSESNSTESSASFKVKGIPCDSQGLVSRGDNSVQEPTCSGIEKNENENATSFSYSHFNSFKSKSNEMVQPGTTNVVGKVKFTPLEQQVMDIWKHHPGVLLFVECGYKYRFFGNDAEIAAKELNIFAHLDHNFMTASIPVHRLHAHVSRLVEKGYKVGVVKQTETAALKAISDNKSAPFSRKLDQIYTRATLIGEDLVSPDHQTVGFNDGLSPGFLLCLNEVPSEQTCISISFVAVNPSTGESLHDAFKDNSCREGLFKRLHIINPAEILTPIVLSENTERLIKHFDARLEKLPGELFDSTNALTRVLSHFSQEMGEECHSGVLEGLTEMPSSTITCLAALQSHLSEFGLQKCIRPEGFQQMSTESKLLKLDASTIQNLQLFRNESGTTHGTLFWALNHTKTKFGARLLHKWLAEPTRELQVLEERQEAISELIFADKILLSTLTTMLSNLPDLDKGLTVILHNKCNPVQYLNILEALCRVCSELSSLSECVEISFQVPLLRNTIKSTIDLLSNVQSYKDNINTQAAKEGDKTKLLKDFSSFPSVVKLINDISDVINSLDKLRPEIAKKLSFFSVNYTTVSGQEYLIEVKNNFAKNVPSNWRKISSTKQVGRYRPPAVEILFNQLQRLHDKLRAECHFAWLRLLQDFSHHYFSHKQAINNLATLDILLSLAHVAQQEGFCRPKLVKSEHAQITIKRGRHPVVPLLFGAAKQFVPNDTNLDGSSKRCMVLSGPNMGGKSCYIRQVALIALMAHLGSYVPAESAEISLLESIHTRMGARDELFQGRSTLMVELEETASILQQVSRHSLVLIDELGRGTGSCDGSAIACATLHHIVSEVQCLTLFVTHYPTVMDMVPQLNGKADNYHMAFLLYNQDGDEFLTFLYEVVEGAADRSYGINVARLANLKKQLLVKAAKVASDLENESLKRRTLREAFLKLWNQ